MPGKKKKAPASDKVPSKSYMLIELLETGNNVIKHEIKIEQLKKKEVFCGYIIGFFCFWQFKIFQNILILKVSKRFSKQYFSFIVFNIFQG